MEATALRDEVRAAEEEIAGGHPDQALARCQQLQSRYPRALVIQRVIGEAYLAMRKPREALAALERCLAGDPEDVRACCARAVVHEIHGDSVAALAWYRRACEIRPEDTGLRETYREVAARLGQPAYRPSAVGLARLYLRGDLFQHAQLEWSGLVTQYPDRLDLQAGLAETYWRAGDLRRASDLARRIVANTPSCLKAILIVAALEHANGRDDEAERHLQRASELDPERRMGRALYGDLIAAGDSMLEILLLGKPRPLAIPSAAQADLQAVQELAQSRSSAIPADFHTIFAETEFMLWGRDQDDAPTTVEPAHTPPGALGPTSAPFGAPAPASAPLGPAGRPAVAASSPFGASAPAGGMADLAPRSDRLDLAARSAAGGLAALEDSGVDDTDSRQASGWVRWLQAQGARSIDRAGRRPSASGPMAAPMSDAFPLAGAASGGLPMAGSASGGLPMGSAASGGLPMSGSASGGLPMGSAASGGLATTGFGGSFPMAGRPSGGLPMPGGPSGTLRQSSGSAPGHSSEDLRDMFAQLAPSPPRAGDSPAGAAGPLDHFLTPPPNESADGLGTFPGADPRMTEHAEDAAFSLPGAADGTLSEPSAEHSSRWGFEEAGNGPGDVDRLGAGLGAPSRASGQWGSASDDDPAAPRMTDGVGSLLAGSDHATSMGANAPDDPSSGTTSDCDFAAQLAVARAHGAAGDLSGALEDYRVILRGSSDYLGDIVGDLQSLASGTDNAEVHRLLGDARIRQGDYVGALESYNRAQALTQGPGA